MKKISLILALTLVLVAAFAASAYADYTNFNTTYNVTTTGTVKGATTNWADGTSTIGGNSGGLTTRGTIGINPIDGTWGSTSNHQIYLPGNPSVVPIHDSYTANTDACAACHAVHTGNGDSLTQWNTFSGTAGITNVCMACHDGTVTKTYNVIAGTYVSTDGGTVKKNNGGLFATAYDAPADTNASAHNVFGGMLTSAAFGGSNPGDIVSDHTGAGTADSHGKWTVAFDCAACHTPHGQGGNARILDPNPNFVQTAGTDPSAAGGNYTTTSETASLSTTTTYSLTKGVPILGWPYGFVVTVNSTTVQSADYYVSLNRTNGSATVTFKNAQTGSLQVSYTPALQVRMNIATPLTSGETVTYQSGMNQFCGACHTDYNTSAIVAGGGNPAASLNGVYSSHTRHAVGYDFSYGGKSEPVTQEKRGLRFEYPGGVKDSGAANITCLTCHYAHGVDKSRWIDTAGTSGIAAYNSDEVAGSSRLKILPNMGVCEACHEKGTGAFSGDFKF